ncbi:SH3 domain-containing protein [Desarmillaria ectypa]|nr:SH3 domain-containing protein [Desarmillaria ectypa]
MDSSALLAHILSQTKQNIEFLASQNKISPSDARDIIAKLPQDPAVADITRSTQNLLVRSPPPPPIPQPYNLPPATTVSRARAIWGYNESRQDPHDLSFRAGDVIEIVAEANADWWTGRHNGVEGLFPSNYVERLPPDTVAEKAAPYNHPQVGPYNNAQVYQPPPGPPAGYGPPPSQYGPPYPAYQPPPPQPAPTQVTTQVTVEEPKKSKFGLGGGGLKNTVSGLSLLIVR